MNIEEQVCTFEQAKRLKELGVKQESYFTFMEAAEYDEMGSKIIKWHPCLFYEKYLDYACCYQPDIEGLSNDGEFIETRGSFSAFTVAELGIMIPVRLKIPSNNYQHYQLCTTYFEKSFGGNAHWRVGYWEHGFAEVNIFCDGETEAESRCALLIHLLEKELVTAEEVNARLINQTNDTK